jgi:RNA polymerase sigma-70 factor, ECF subfamily
MTLAVSETPSSNYALHDPDVRLMLQVRNDDALAFEELVLRYQNRLVTVLEQLVHGREQAEDLAQEVFLRVYRARKSYQPQAKFCTWLFTIANNVAKNSKRSSARRREVNLSSQGGDDTAYKLENMAQAASGLMPARQLDKAERAIMVRQAVSLLDERQRLALILSKFEGMSYEEIATSMEISVKAVKSLLFRARENVRLKLEPYIQDGLRPTPSSSES